MVAAQSANFGSLFLAMRDDHDHDGGAAMVAQVDAINEIVERL